MPVISQFFSVLEIGNEMLSYDSLSELGWYLTCIVASLATTAANLCSVAACLIRVQQIVCAVVLVAAVVVLWDH